MPIPTAQLSLWVLSNYKIFTKHFKVMWWFMEVYVMANLKCASASESASLDYIEAANRYWCYAATLLGPKQQKKNCNPGSLSSVRKSCLCTQKLSHWHLTFSETQILHWKPVCLQIQPGTFFKLQVRRALTPLNMHPLNCSLWFLSRWEQRWSLAKAFFCPIHKHLMCTFKWRRMQEITERQWYYFFPTHQEEGKAAGPLLSMWW